MLVHLFLLYYYLFRQKWRMSINRAAEAMTIFAVICAANVPNACTMGRPWVRLCIGLCRFPNVFG